MIIHVKVLKNERLNTSTFISGGLNLGLAGAHSRQRSLATVQYLASMQSAPPISRTRPPISNPIDIQVYVTLGFHNSTPIVLNQFKVSLILLEGLGR